MERGGDKDEGASWVRGRGVGRKVVKWEISPLGGNINGGQRSGKKLGFGRRIGSPKGRNRRGWGRRRGSEHTGSQVGSGTGRSRVRSGRERDP